MGERERERKREREGGREREGEGKGERVGIHWLLVYVVFVCTWMYIQHEAFYTENTGGRGECSTTTAWRHCMRPS